MTQKPTVPVLAVDLDGTLLNSDTLYESVWSALARNPLSFFPALTHLLKGRAELKRHLVDASDVSIEYLPFNAEVIEYVRRHRETGGRTALVTASDQRLADRIAKHLDIFDEVHGSDGTTNLKGARKAAFLNSSFGQGGYAYMGDSSADLAIWPHTAKAITVNAAAAVRGKVDVMPVTAEHLLSGGSRIKGYIKALRPHQWAKNFLVFLPMLIGQSLTVESFVLSLMAFIAFSMVASSAYVFNDLLDLSADRAHPRKRERPFASGAVPIAHGTFLGVFMLLGGLTAAAATSWALCGIVAAYYVLTTAYSLDFKRRFVIDICVLAGLYTMRIVAGGVASGVELSVWLLAFSLFFFFSLAAVKRQAELVDTINRSKSTAAGRNYEVEDISIVAGMALSAGYVAVLVMALYINTLQVSTLYSTPEYLWGICCILLYWISRTIMIAHRGWMHDDPLIYAFKDRISQACGLLVLIFAVAAITL